MVHSCCKTFRFLQRTNVTMNKVSCWRENLKYKDEEKAKEDQGSEEGVLRLHTRGRNKKRLCSSNLLMAISNHISCNLDCTTR